jgi:hypothetical protein
MQINYVKQTLENIEGAIKKGQSRETGNIEYTRRRHVYFVSGKWIVVGVNDKFGCHEVVTELISNCPF